MTNKTRINVCLASGESYLPYMATAMVSVLHTAALNDDIHFYILCNHVSEKSKQYIRTLQKLKNCEIVFIDVNTEKFDTFPSAGAHITNTTYFRYQIAELCPDIDRIVYLDCDTIVKQSLAPLFTQDLTDYYLAGVQDVGYYYWKDHNPDFIYKEGFYINAGVLLINLDAWRKNDLFTKLVEFTLQNAKKIAIGDQDVINQVCFGKIKQLDYKWNVQDSFYRTEPERAANPNCEQIIKAAENPAIIHYTQAKKPWNSTGMPRANDWIEINCIRLGFIKGCSYKLKLALQKYLPELISFYRTERGINIKLLGKFKTKIFPLPRRKK